MTLRLDRLQAANFNPRGLQTLWQRHCEALEAANTDLQGQITAIAAAQAAATAAQGTANTAVTSAATAQGTADTAKLNDKISSSLTTPTSVLSAVDAGTDATITIANHTRKWGDATSLAVTGGTVTGLAYSTAFAVYYDDTTTSVANPTYSATATLQDGQFNVAPGRIYCGQITTPALGAGGTSGDGPRGTGGGGPYP